MIAMMFVIYDQDYLMIEILDHTIEGNYFMMCSYDSKFHDEYSMYLAL